MSSLAASLNTQKRVLNALLMRELITRYGRDNLGFLWLFIEPMLFVLFMMGVIVLSRGAINISGINIIGFAITGYSTVLLWRNAANRCGNAITPNFALLHHRNVTVLDLYLVRILIEIAGATLSLVFLLIIFIALGLAPLPSDPLLMIEAWALLAWFSAGLGMTIGVCIHRSEFFSRMWSNVSLIFFSLSGAMFMVAWLPPTTREFFLYIPTVHITEMIRHGYFGNAVKTFEDPAYLITINLLLTLTGLILVRKTAENLEAP